MVFRCGMTTDHNICRNMSDHFQKEIGFLGIESSPAFVRAPEGNGCAEQFIRTLKETCCRCATSRRSRNCARHCWRSAKSTTRRGSLNGTASSARRRSVRSNFNPSPGRRRVQSGVPQTAGGTARPRPIRSEPSDTAPVCRRRADNPAVPALPIPSAILAPPA